jgi:hypothetical protein
VDTMCVKRLPSLAGMSRVGRAGDPVTERGVTFAQIATGIMGRAKYHAYYCYLLRATHAEKVTEWHSSYLRMRAKPCRKCVKYYGVNAPNVYLERGGK